MRGGAPDLSTARPLACGLPELLTALEKAKDTLNRGVLAATKTKAPPPLPQTHDPNPPHRAGSLAKDGA